MGLQGVVLDEAAGADAAVRRGRRARLGGDVADAAQLAWLLRFAGLVGEDGAFFEFRLRLGGSGQPDGLHRAAGRCELSLQDGGVSRLCVPEVELWLCYSLGHPGVDVHAELLQLLTIRLVGHSKTVFELYIFPCLALLPTELQLLN